MKKREKKKWSNEGSGDPKGCWVKFHGNHRDLLKPVSDWIPVSDQYWFNWGGVGFGEP